MSSESADPEPVITYNYEIVRIEGTTVTIQSPGGHIFAHNKRPFIDAVLLAMLKDGMNPHDIAERAYQVAEQAVTTIIPGAKPTWGGPHYGDMLVRGKQG